MKLSAMRNLNEQDPLGGLGRRVPRPDEYESEPKEPKRVGPGILQTETGQLITDVMRPPGNQEDMDMAKRDLRKTTAYDRWAWVRAAHERGVQTQIWSPESGKWVDLELSQSWRFTDKNSIYRIKPEAQS